MRKFISLMSAAAMVAALVPSVAMAEDTVLYSDSFNGYPTSAKTAEGTVFAAQASDDFVTVVGNPDWQWIFKSPASRTLDKLTVGFDGTRGDDTAAIMINEKEEATDKYLSMPQNRFQSRCKPQISGLDQYAANAGESLVISFNAMLTAGDNGAATLAMGDLGNLTSTELGTDEWKAVKLVAKDGYTTIYIDGSQVGDPVSAVPSIIRPLPFASDTKLGSYANVCIDDLVILSSADGASAVIPAAEDHSLEVEPEATEVPAAAEITDTVKIDFDETDFEAAGVTVSTNKATYEIAAIADGLSGNESKLLKIDQTSTEDNASNGGYFSVDIASITSGKSHIIIDYDFYTAVSGNSRVKTIIADKIAAGSDGKISSAPTIINQGITGKGLINALDGVWVHTKVDVDLATGIGTYEVVGPEENVIGSGKITTDLKTLTTIGFVSWSPNTSYIDNLAIATGGETGVVEPTEPDVAEVEAVAKAAVVTNGDELRISDGTNGAVFRFETKDAVPEGKTVKKAELIVKAAPRSYKDTDARFESTGIMTYKVKSNWNSDAITGEAWNNLSKDDPINTQNTAKYPAADSTVIAPWQTLEAIDVTDMIGEDGVAVFAFKANSAREHAIDAVLVLTLEDAKVKSTNVEAAAKAAVVTNGDELRVIDGTNGAVFRFETSDAVPAGHEIKKVELVVKAAPRSYSESASRFESTGIMTYKVKSNWNSDAITGEAWNNLSKDDPINTQDTAKYSTADSTEIAPWQTLEAIDVTDMIGEDGVAVFAFKANSAREHAIDAYLVVTTEKVEWTQYTFEKDANGVLTSIIMTPVDDPTGVILGDNEFLWNQDMVPYKAD